MLGAAYEKDRQPKAVLIIGVGVARRSLVADRRSLEGL